MRNLIHKSLPLFVLIVVTISIKGASAQSFYKSYSSYLKSRDHRKDLSKHKKDLLANQFGSELQQLFKKVKRETGISMLDNDTLYMFTQSNSSDGSYSCLVWNKKHSCYYKVSHLPVYFEYDEKLPAEREVSAPEKLLELGPIFKRIIENIDTVGYKTYMRSFTTPVNTGIQFVVAIKSKKRWHFFSSKAYSTNKGE